MASFDPAFEYVMGNEGQDLLDDPKTGEFSRFGLTAKTLVRLGLCTQEGARAYVESLDLRGAREVYRDRIWPMLFGSIRDQRVASKLFDMVVNMGEYRAVVLTQQACMNLGLTVSPDGVFGTQTLTAVNTLQAAQLLALLVRVAVKFYQGLVAEHPEKFLKYAQSWKERAQKLP